MQLLLEIKQNFAEPKRESKVLYEVSNEMVKAWIPEKCRRMNI